LLDRGSVERQLRQWYRRQLKSAIERALLLHCVDLVHMHGLDFYEYELPREIPVLVTLHLPIGWYEIEKLKRIRERVQLCCVSQSQRRSCPPELRDLPVVENGVALGPWRPSEKSNFTLALGRICPEKNMHAALQAGSLAETPVYIGGRIYPYHEHQAYFEERLKPLLGESSLHVSHRFLGPVSATQRRALLARARCLLHPTLAPETSSLVA